jgi:hypothetical protein
MTKRDRHLMLQLVLAMAVCGLVAVLDRPLIGLVGAAICVTVFGIRAYSPAGSRVGEEARSATAPVSPSDDEEAANTGLGASSYNPQNPAFPLYYPPADRD